jgi:hypothetical protein
MPLDVVPINTPSSSLTVVAPFTGNAETVEITAQRATRDARGKTILDNYEPMEKAFSDQGF